jgi:phosphoglycolate phosphatase
MKVVLFDIDGTLLRGYGAGSRAMLRAGRAICGEPFSLEGVMMGGGLDPVIYREAARRMGLHDHGALHDAFRDRYLEELHAELRSFGGVSQVEAEAAAVVAAAGALAAQGAQGIRRPELLPGIVPLLAELATRRDVAVGLVTGNYQRAVPIKLASVGLATTSFIAGGFGDDADLRPALVPVALERMQQLLSRPLRAADVIVVGDTVRDVDCALQNGARCLAVGTGKVPLEDLHRAGAQRVVADLSDPNALLSWL